MRIGELSRRTGVHERLLRSCEEQGLLAPERRLSGYREYREEVVGAVRRIRGLLAAGLNTSTIVTILPCLRETGERLIPACPDLLADLHRERERITRSITDLERSRGALDGVIAAAPPVVARQALTAVEG
ncbi:MerR family transcriptional regulator [Streptomyces sp. NPDC049944]|uniref:MerR family transcriptional regulator n=1 Tax=Streptomyces sp. NPDC049944 TaxID=3155657 RepID=UPI00343FA642